MFAFGWLGWNHHRPGEADAVRTIVEHRAERPVAFFSLDGRPHLQVVRVETTDPAAYQALLTEVTP